MLVNKLSWISSPGAPENLLKELDSKMSEFYASFSQRKDYQDLNDDLHVEGHPNNILADHIAAYIVSKGFKEVLEIGCGSGKIYGHLLKHNFKGNYTGSEMAEYVIKTNKEKFPDANWEKGSVYDFATRSDAYDCCFAFYVLEHLIYPDKGLSAMMNTIKAGGTLILVFPDFCCSGIVPSQKIGLHYGYGAKYKLKEGKVLDAFVSFIEASMMRNTLKKLNQVYGDFVINYKPFCLEDSCTYLVPDMDAIYLSNKKEVENWAKKSGYYTSYPQGTEGMMARNAFICITKN